MRHKLIKYTDNGSIVTDDDLKAYLEQINFEVSPIAPIISRPTDIIRPTVPKYVVQNGQIIVHPLWVVYQQKLSDYGQALAADKQRYTDELNATIEYLELTFDGVVTYAKTGQTNPNGTAIWAWLPSTAYTYRQCALKLTGATRPADVIGFICYHYFGS